MSKLRVTLGMIPDGCDNAVEISEMSITYAQLPDTNSNSDDYQHLKISAQNNGVGEDGWYYDLSIPEGEHWSIDDPEDLSNLVKDFKSRMEMNITKESSLKDERQKYDC